MKQKPNLPFWSLWNLSFGFFGVQIAYALQSANISRIFRTLGADPHSLSFFWILPPLMGILVQPIVGTLSDKTWTRFGRRIPYLFIGALVAVAVMCLLPNAGSLGLQLSAVMMFGLIMLMLLDDADRDTHRAGIYSHHQYKNAEFNDIRYLVGQDLFVICCLARCGINVKTCPVLRK